MNIINLSAEPYGKVIGWLPNTLQAEQLVFLPDACPGKSPLPTGTVVHTKQSDWRRFAISDCGCGMRLMKSDLSIDKLTQKLWDDLATCLRKSKGKLGDLGGGNHFCDALIDHLTGEIYFLVHTGSRKESGLVDELIDKPVVFDKEFCRIVQWAEDNRAAIQKHIERVFGKVELVLDLPHNTFEQQDDGSVIIRKGSVKLKPGELSVIPSHMSGDMALVRATNAISEICNSMSHGTGRAMSRSDCKELARDYDFKELRENIMMPSVLKDGSLRTEGPFAYRELDDCLMLIDDYVTVEARFKVVAYMGHL